jgi:hypothetical protein
MRRRRQLLLDRLAEWRLPAPERRAAVAERRVEARLELERYPAVLIAERMRARDEADARRWGCIYGRWKY